MKKNSPKPKLLLDTHSLIKLFAKEEGWESTQKILLQVENGEAEAAISVVTLTEIYYKYLHEKTIALAQTRVNELRYAAAVKKLGIDEKVAITAGEFKGKYAVPIADAYISATAYHNDSIIISDDTDFNKIPEITVQRPQDYCNKYGL